MVATLIQKSVETHSQDKTLIIDNWRVLHGFGIKGFSKKRTRLDKGHKNQFKLLTQRPQKPV